MNFAAKANGLRAIPGVALGVFNYLGPMDEAPLFCGDQQENNRINLEPHVMPVHDMRQSGTSLDAEGFMLGNLRLDIGQEDNVEVIASIYRPMIEDYLRELLGAPKIATRMPMLRWSARTPRPERINSFPANYVHADFSRQSFHQMAAVSVADDPERDRWLGGRYAVIQTWRALSPPPQDMPLAVMDRRTIAPEDVVLAHNIVGRGDSEQKFLNYTFRHNAAHCWSYVSDMTADDVLVFIGFDSKDDTIPGIPHSAFDYAAASGRDTYPRMSCELRAFVYWG